LAADEMMHALLAHVAQGDRRCLVDYFEPREWRVLAVAAMTAIRAVGSLGQLVPLVR